MASRALQSITALARLLKVSRKRVERHLHLLTLPEPIRKFLAEHREPQYVRYFSARKLHQIARMDVRSAWRVFRSMVRKAEQEAGIWRTDRE